MSGVRFQHLHGVVSIRVYPNREVQKLKNALDSYYMSAHHPARRNANDGVVKSTHIPNITIKRRSVNMHYNTKAARPKTTASALQLELSEWCPHTQVQEMKPCGSSHQFFWRIVALQADLQELLHCFRCSLPAAHYLLQQ